MDKNKKGGFIKIIVGVIILITNSFLHISGILLVAGLFLLIYGLFQTFQKNQNRTELKTLAVMFILALGYVAYLGYGISKFNG